MKKLRHLAFDPGTHGAITSIGLLLLRLLVGGLMVVQHGKGKLIKVLEGELGFADPLGIGSAPSLVLATLGESLAPALLVLGLATRPAAIPAAITMGVAAFVFHAADPLKERELSLLYLAVFTFFAFSGAGRYSLDALIKRRA